MRPEWPDDTVFQRLVLDVESEHCERCGRVLHVCDHRCHRIHTLQGAWNWSVAWRTAPTTLARHAGKPSAPVPNCP